MTNRERREAQNARCHGGMRNPLQVIRRPRFERLRYVMRSVRGVLSGVMARHHDDVRAFCTRLREGELQDGDDLPPALLAEARRAVDLLFHTPDETSDLPTPLRPAVWEHIASEAGGDDVEKHFHQCLRTGAPVGVEDPIPEAGYLPAGDACAAAEADSLDASFWDAQVRAWRNYKSAEELAAELENIFRRDVAKGFSKQFESPQAARAAIGDFVPVKIAIIPKKTPGKFRLICDLTRNGVNIVIHLPDRIVLPRLREAMDMVRRALERAPPGARVELAVVDVADAFKLIPLRPNERKYGVVIGESRTYVPWVLTFGGRSSPLWWGRCAGVLARTGQAMFPDGELEMQMYVDDPLLALLGASEHEREDLLFLLLLWWRVLGVPLQLPKGTLGDAADWIGGTLSVAAGQGSVTVQRARITGVCDDILRMLGRPWSPRDEVRSLAGKLSSVASVVPYASAFLGSLFAAAYSSSERVFAAQIRDDLEWLLWMLSECNLEQGLHRPVALADLRRDGVHIETDASPEGIGAILFVGGKPVEFFAEPLGPGDLALFAAPEDAAESRGQQVFELLAVVCAARVWRARFANGAVPVGLRSDNGTVLAAIRSMRVRGHAAAGRLVRELALLGAVHNTRYAAAAHVPGSENVLPDALSRSASREQAVAELQRRGAARVSVPARGDGFWMCRGSPPTRSGALSGGTFLQNRLERGVPRVRSAGGVPVG